MSTVVLKLQ